jgi:cytochrome b-561
MQKAIEGEQNERSLRRWFDERLGIGAFYRKYGRKAFPVHSTFFFGEMAAFSFVILVATGVYLALIYTPSNVDVTVEGETLPEAYASVQLIESIPVANLFRNVHHWAAHLMVASILLHLFRIYFTGVYRKPREINWVVGVILLGLTLMAGFVGYALPYDSYAVTATGIGYSIARSIPWVGDVAAELFFGGAFPSLGSIPRLYTIHVFIVPVVLALLIGFHLLVVVKQKHTQPGYAKKLAEPGRVLGVPLLPYQAVLAIQLMTLMFGVLFLLSALVSPHPTQDFGPPGPATPEVKPDWYLLWIYGFLKIVPSEASFDLFGATIGPNFIGGMLFPAVIFGVLTLAPWIDETNRRALRRFEYLEPPRQGATRFAVGMATLTFLSTLFLAAFYDELDMSLTQIWVVVLFAPVVVGAAAYVWCKELPVREQIDATSADTPGVRSPILDPTALQPSSRLARVEGAPMVVTEEPSPVPEAEEPVPTPGISPQTVPRVKERPFSPRTAGARGEQARAALVAALEECGDLATAVEQLEGEDLLEVLQYIDSLRLGLTESNQILQGVVQGYEAGERD